MDTLHFPFLLKILLIFLTFLGLLKSNIASYFQVCHECGNSDIYIYIFYFHILLFYYTTELCYSYSHTALKLHFASLGVHGEESQVQWTREGHRQPKKSENKCETINHAAAWSV